MRQGHRTDHLTRPRSAYETDRPPVVRESGDSVVVEFAGEIDILTLHRMTPLLDTVAAGPYRVVALDLTGVTFLDCSGLTLLVRTARRAGARGARTTVVCRHPLTLRIIALAGLDETLAPVDSVREALGRTD
ncbi:anti-sigma factor antagonist [Streptomyces sp. SID5785]|uniref:anti-sigma factor antagonist n=1 Tax=Streptomyces sp. SID5785 TaxID=2690309 RepID=UPI001360C11C|nr:anti-sigma factor antagonist [Streptomyces sp. SID5785]MZD06473.1 anti-sigma factor antagonist [Streptomyces sp. SID5785]